ncbi:MAG: hypothetical protein AB7F43_03845 [Bacteriovoracia bacterium]
MKRLVCCQGSLQLITAIAALKYRVNSSSRTSADTLLIFDVSEEFSLWIKKIAEKIWKFEKILTISKIDEVEVLNEKDFAEIFVCRNWQPGNEYLLRKFKASIKIGYGDGIGYFFGPDLFQRRNIWTRIRQDFLRRRENLDLGIYLLPEIFNEVPDHKVEVPSSKYLLETIDDCAAQFYDVLNDRKPNHFVNDSVLLVLPGNYSAVFRTGKEDGSVESIYQEIDAYVKKISLYVAQRKTNPFVIVKPHPRATSLQNQVLKERIKNAMNLNAYVIETPESYFPIEILCKAWKIKNADVLTFTTAGVPMKVIFDFNIDVGFGEKILKESFGNNMVMVRTENVLQEAIRKVSCRSI